MVCTGNICRSPMAERLLAVHAAELGATVEVGSAGVRALVGHPAEPGAVAAMARRGIDLGDHVARSATTDLVDGADLVITMEGAHVVDLVSGGGAQLARTFTLPELVGRSGALPRGAATVDDWLVDVGEGRSSRALVGSTDLDVADPYGRSGRAFRRCADELDELCRSLAAALWGEGGGREQGTEQ